MVGSLDNTLQLRNIIVWPKKINVLFPETSQYFLGSVDRIFFFFFGKNVQYTKSIKIVKNTLKIEEKFSDVPKQFGVGHKKLGSVEFPDQDIFFFFWPLQK